MMDGRDVEILEIGFEGLIGGHAVSAASSTPYRTVMAMEGAALRLSVREFQAAMSHHRTLQQMLSATPIDVSFNCAAFSILSRPSFKRAGCPMAVDVPRPHAVWCASFHP